MAIRWDQFPHEIIRLQIYSRLKQDDLARSSEDSLRRILQRRLPSRDADDHRRFIEIEARTLVEHLRCTRDVYGEFVDSQRCEPRIEAHWVVLRFAVFPTALSILRQRILEYSTTTTVLAKDLSLLFGIPTRSCSRLVDEGIALITLPDLEDKTAATDEEISCLGGLIDEDGLLMFKDIREDGGAVGRFHGGGPFSTDDSRSTLSSFDMGPIQAGFTLPEWMKIRRKLWDLGKPWTEGLCDLFMSVQEELLAQWSVLPTDSLIQELELDQAKSRLRQIVVSVPKNSAAKNWQEIEILFVSDHRLQIRVNGEDMESLNFAEFGFADGRTHNPNKGWELLRALAEERGTIRDGKPIGAHWSKVEKRIQEIRRVLREYFGLADDPIPFVEGTGYQTLFKINCTPSFRT